MRTAFINQLIVEARTNPKIFLVVGDLGYSVVEPFANEFPERFLNSGIAEQNMTGIACGLAKEGYTVFTYSIGNFPTLRCMEQIRYDVCYHNLDVKIVAVGGGYAYASLGTSHHATEEIGMLRSIPNITIAAPGDPLETTLITKQFCNNAGPAYLRLGKAGEPIVHTNTEIEIKRIGEPVEVKSGKITAILSTGAMLKYAQNFIEQNNREFGLYSFPIIKPFNEKSLLKLTEQYQTFITIEEHQLSTGFGSAILELFNNLVQTNLLQAIPKIKRIGIPDKFISVAGSQEYIRKEAGLIL
jgi:transketolase